MGSGMATRRKILEAAYTRFYREGFARVGVDAVAEAAGVTKRTLYYHFSSKDELLAAVLDLQHELALERIRGWARNGEGDPAAIVARLFESLADWMAQPGWQGSGFSRAAMELAALPGHPARAAARNHKAAIEAWLIETLGRAGLPEPRPAARQIMLLLEGCQVMTLVDGDPAYAKVAADAAQALLRAAPGPSPAGAGPT